MVDQIKVFYEGWGECWHWGTLAMAGAPHSPILCALPMLKQILHRSV